MSKVACIGCGAVFPDMEGPVHAYMESSPACWHAFGQVLAREYTDPELSAVHRLCVDSYAVQHPGGESRQAIQSVGIHLSRLCLLLERELSPEYANAAMLRIGKVKASMCKLRRPASLGSVTVADVLATTNAKDHVMAARRWAQSAWQAWSAHHAIVRQWVAAI